MESSIEFVKVEMEDEEAIDNQVSSSRLLPYPGLRRTNRDTDAMNHLALSPSEDPLEAENPLDSLTLRHLAAAARHTSGMGYFGAQDEDYSPTLRIRVKKRPRTVTNFTEEQQEQIAIWHREQPMLYNKKLRAHKDARRKYEVISAFARKLNSTYNELFTYLTSVRTRIGKILHNHSKGGSEAIDTSRMSERDLFIYNSYIHLAPHIRDRNNKVTFFPKRRKNEEEHNGSGEADADDAEDDYDMAEVVEGTPAASPGSQEMEEEEEAAAPTPADEKPAPGTPPPPSGSERGPLKCSPQVSGLDEGSAPASPLPPAGAERGPRRQGSRGDVSAAEAAVVVKYEPPAGDRVEASPERLTAIRGCHDHHQERWASMTPAQMHIEKWGEMVQSRLGTFPDDMVYEATFILDEALHNFYRKIRQQQQGGTTAATQTPRSWSTSEACSSPMCTPSPTFPTHCQPQSTPRFSAHSHHAHTPSHHPSPTTLPPQAQPLPNSPSLSHQNHATPPPQFSPSLATPSSGHHIPSHHPSPATLPPQAHSLPSSSSPSHQNHATPHPQFSPSLATPSSGHHAASYHSTPSSQVKPALPSPSSISHHPYYQTPPLHQAAPPQQSTPQHATTQAQPTNPTTYPPPPCSPAVPATAPLQSPLHTGVLMAPATPQGLPPPVTNATATRGELHTPPPPRQGDASVHHTHTNL